jgi:hypothetical protein
MGSIALAIGNGESRRGLDLKAIKSKFITVGCNALHRDFIPNHLVCCDARMVREALENPLTDNCEIHVRENWHQYFRKILKNKNVKHLPELPYQGTLRPDNHIHWGSGPYAVLIAASLADTVYLVGFDLYGHQSQVNNIYKDTENYQGSHTAAVDPSYWIYQIAKIFDCFPEKQFIVVNQELWNLPAEWQKSNTSVVFSLNTLYN